MNLRKTQLAAALVASLAVHATGLAAETMSMAEGTKYRDSDVKLDGYIGFQGAIGDVTYEYGITQARFATTAERRKIYSEPWTVDCYRELLKRTRWCFVRSGQLWIHVPERGGRSVTIGTDHFPGSTVSIRIDDGPVQTFSAQGDGELPAPATTRTIAALTKGRVAVTRFMKWPHRTWKDEETDLGGLREALDFASWAFKNMR
mgnify:CR=1 FL=1